MNFFGRPISEVFYLVHIVAQFLNDPRWTAPEKLNILTCGKVIMGHKYKVNLRNI